MSKAEILAELSNLTPEDREEILDRLWHLEEEEAIRLGPTISEKTLLDRELDEYQAKPDAGAPWSEVETRLRRKK